MAIDKSNRVLVTGGGTFLGINIASALLAQGAEVTMLLRPGTEERLGPLAAQVRWLNADVWDAASLKGRARGHGTVIHTVGSMVADPAQGLTYQRLNVISARNTANMCVSDGVQHMILMSTVNAPWVNRRYVRAKREAESYLERVGLRSTVIRAPLTYVRDTRRPLFYRLVTFFGRLPLFSWTALGNMAPLPMDVLSRGVARVALQPPSRSIMYAKDLRRLNTRDELRGDIPAMRPFADPETESLPFEALDEETPFGWTPTINDDR